MKHDTLGLVRRLVGRSTRAGLALIAIAGLAGVGQHAFAQSDTVKVGVLHSLSGTMAISEITVKNATLLAIDEINAAGGVMSKKVTAIVEDGASEPATFAQKAQKLIQQDGVSTVFIGLEPAAFTRSGGA